MTTNLASKPVSSKASAQPRFRIWGVFLVFLCLLTFLPTLGVTKLIDPSDGFFAETAREMLESKNFITPTLNYEPWNDKPILNHWLVALSYMLLGVSEYASRVPAALCATLTCLSTFYFSRMFVGRKAAFLSACVLLSGYLFSTLARVSLTDMPLTLFVNTGLFALFAGAIKDNKRLRTFGWAAMGLAFLTKGPISLLILIGSYSLFSIFTTPKPTAKGLINSFGKLGYAKGLLITALIAAPWFIVAGVQTSGRFLYDFFVVQNFQRATGALVLNHEQPFWFYAPIVLLAFFPYSAFFPALLPVMKKWWQNRFTESDRVRFLYFCISICITVFGGFSILKGKLPTYVLPLMPSLSTLFAAGIYEALKARQQKFLLSSAAITMIASVAAFFTFSKSIEATGSADIFAKSLMAVYFLSAAAFGILVMQNKRMLAIHQFVSVCVLTSAVLIPFVFIEFYEHHQLDYAKILNIGLAQKGTLNQVWDTSPSAPFYGHKPVPKIRSFFDYAAVVAYPGEHYVIGKKEYCGFLERAPIHHVVARSGDWALYSVQDPKQELLNNYYILERLQKSK